MTRANGEWKACEICGKEVYAQPNQLRRGEGRYCSRQCKGQAHRRDYVKPLAERPRYINKQGYVMVPVKSGRQSAQYRAEHRIVVEQMLGCPLTPDEHIHHLNGDKADNRPENLLVLGNSEHQKLHDWGLFRSRRVTLTCVICGTEYQRKRSRAAESSCCSRACQVKRMHEAIAEVRKTHKWTKGQKKRPKG